MKIIILFIHHKTCPVTLYHYKQFLAHHNNDNDVAIVPITYPDHADSCIEGSYIARNLSVFRKNEKKVYQKIRNNNPYDLDCLIWDYVLFSGERADKIIVMEWDALCRQHVKDFYADLLGCDLAGSVVRPTVEAHIRKRWQWHWLKENYTVSADFINKYRQYITSITPTCGIMIDWELAVKNAGLVRDRPHDFDNIHNELAIGTLSRIHNAVPKGFSDSKQKMINWRKNLIDVQEVGIFHPVKSMHAGVRKFNFFSLDSYRIK